MLFEDEWAEAFDDLERRREADDGFEYDYYQRPRIVTCKYCHTAGLSWAMHNGRWMMRASDGSFHTCLTDRKKANESQKKLEVKRKLIGVLGLNPSVDEINSELRIASKEEKKYGTIDT